MKKKNDYYKNLREANKKSYYELCPEYNYIPTNYSAVKRIVVFGDIHGDFNLIKALLIFSKVASFDSNNVATWIGGDCYVVQVGDQIDRARPALDGSSETYEDEHSDIRVMELLNDLHNQALKQNGKICSLIGNHELMASLGIMNYVSQKGISEFKNEELDQKDPNYSGLNARIYAFKPGNKIAKMMACTRSGAIIIGSNLFVHGGIIDSVIDKMNIVNRDSLEAFNILVRKWLVGKMKREEINKYITTDDSPFWNRVLGKIPPNTDFNNPACSNNLSKTMTVLEIDNMIIAHTPQEKINSTCSNRLWRVDTASSRAFEYVHQYNKKQKPPMQYLEILNDKDFYVRTFMENF
jgi:hypothetical protein